MIRQSDSNGENTIRIDRTQEQEQTKYKVLHIDDNEEFGKLFRLTFIKWLDITSVSSGTEALQMLKEHDFEAVITDFEMPDMNGLAMLRAIREEFPSFPVIFLTGQGSEEIAREAFISGANDYFIKEMRGFSFKARLVNSIRHAVVQGKTEIALLREKDRALKYFNCTKDMTIIVNNDMSIRMINKSCCELLGYDEMEVLGKDWITLAFPPESREKLKRYFEQVFHEEVSMPTPYENDVLTRNGSRKTISWTNSILRNERGRIDGILFSGQDITERKENEKHIRHLNRVLKSIRNVNKFIIQEKEQDILISKVCEDFVKTGGYDSACIILTDKDNFYESHYQAGKKSQFSALIDSYINGEPAPCIRNVLEGSNPVLIPDEKECVSDKEKKLKPCHDSRIIVKLLANDRLYGIMIVCFPTTLNVDEEEKQLLSEVADDIAYALFNIDIRKEHERYEAALVESEHSLRTIFDSVNEAIFVRDAKTYELLDVNRKAQEIFGHTPGPDNNYTSIEINIGIPPYTFDILRKHFEAAAAGEPQIFEWVVKDKYGRTLTMEYILKKTVIRGRNCVLAIMRDVTHRKEAEKRLQESEKNYLTIFNLSNDPLLILNPETYQLLEGNNSFYETFGLSPENLKTLTPENLFTVHEHRDTGHIRQLLSKAAEGEIKKFTSETVSKNNKHLKMEVRMNNIVIGGNNLLLTGFFDITERKQGT